MIKTHTGELIEPRVGDDVKVLWVDDAAEIHEARGKIVEVWDCGRILLDDDYSYEQEHCTLLHRPFQAGDKVEGGAENWLWIIKEFHKRDNVLVLVYPKIGYETDVITTKSSQVRHTNPAWRDHPDYKPEPPQADEDSAVT